MWQLYVFEYFFEMFENACFDTDLVQLKCTRSKVMGNRSIYGYWIFEIL
jgi:hypothetical protein